MVMLPIAWFLIWYVAWFDHDDCAGALQQIGGSAPELFRTTKAECDAAARVRHAVETYGLAALILGELALGLLVRRR